MNRKCFECGSTNNLHDHHVVPRCRGGTKTILVCEKCHSLCHHEDENMFIGRLSRAKKKRKNIQPILKGRVFVNSKKCKYIPHFYGNKIYIFSPSMTNFFPHHKEKTNIHYSLSKGYQNKVYCNNTDLLPTGICARQIMLFLTNEVIKNQNNNIIFESETFLFKKIKENPKNMGGSTYRKVREDLLKMLNVHVEVRKGGSEKVLYDGKIVNNFCLRGPRMGGEICLDKKFFNFLIKNYIIIESNEYFSLFPSSLVSDIYLILKSGFPPDERENNFMSWGELRKCLNKEHIVGKGFKSQIKRKLQNIENPSLKVVHGGVELL